MGRVGKYTLVGGFLSLLVLALYAACDGYLHGAGANRQHPPGPEGTATNTMVFVGFLGMQVWLIGAFAGMVAAMVGQAVEGVWGR